MNKRSAYKPKKYNYVSKYFDINKGINFLNSQASQIEKIKIELLNKYKYYIESQDMYSNNGDAIIIANDIKMFLTEFNKARELLYKTLNRVSKGAYGENIVRDIIYSYESEWKILQNATLSIKGNRIENDFLIVDESGISTIEVKNMGSVYEELIIDNLGRVSRKNKFGEDVESFDMVAQSNRHLAYLKQIVKEEFKYNIPIYQHIVMTSKIKIKNDSNFNFIGTNQIYSNIKNQEKALDSDKVKQVYQFLFNSIEEGEMYPYPDYISVLTNNYKLILKSLTELIQ